MRGPLCRLDLLRGCRSHSAADGARGSADRCANDEQQPPGPSAATAGLRADPYATQRAPGGSLPLARDDRVELILRLVARGDDRNASQRTPVTLREVIRPYRRRAGCLQASQGHKYNCELPACARLDHARQNLCLSQGEFNRMALGCLRTPYLPHQFFS